jgi:NAD+ diphosphatase
MAVVSPDGNQCLLGQYPGTNFFTCLAGFVEQGESVEEACRRETLEEAGIKVGQVQLHSSQPWPVGRGGACELMIGCMAQAVTVEVHLDEEEMAAAVWFSREDVRAMVERSIAGATPTDAAPVVPGPAALAHHLLKSFADGFRFAPPPPPPHQPTQPAVVPPARL